MVVKKESSAQLATWLEIEMEKVVKKRRRTDEVLLRSKLSKREKKRQSLGVLPGKGVDGFGEGVEESVQDEQETMASELEEEAEGGDCGKSISSGGDGMEGDVGELEEIEGGDCGENVSSGDDGMEGGGVGEHPGAKSGKSQRIQGLYKPPTHAELQALKETQDLFKSNLMKLQITELLEEVKPKKTVSRRQLEALLHTLKEMLMDMPTGPQVDLCEGLSLLHGKVKYPLSFAPENCKGKFSFGPPAAVRVVGSYLLGTWMKPNLSVDLELSLPMSCLQVKDILNYRYFHKRALYLCLVAAHLRKKKRSLPLKKVMFEFHEGNRLIPILCLIPEGKHLSKYRIRIHTSVLEHEYFKQSKLAPDHNNVRRHFLSSRGLMSDQSDESGRLGPPGPQSDVGPPTPHYNAALLAELGARERHLKELFLCAQECPGLVDAIILSKVWVTQRSINKGFGAITSFHLSMLLCALVAHKKLNHLMSCYQIFRVTLQHLVSSDWTEKPFSFPRSPLPPKPPVESFQSAFDVVFLDSTGLLNLCADISKQRYRWLQHEAGLALELLDDPTSRGFEALFMRPVPVHHKFDLLCHISLSTLAPQTSISEQATREGILLDGFAWPHPLVLSRLLPTLHRGLTNRVKLIVALCSQQDDEWAVIKSPPNSNAGHVTLGLLLDTDHAFSILDMGPSADSSEAVDFRSFWGERSGLRRFADGSINEAVVWGQEGEGPEERRTVCHQIICHVLHRHFSIPADSVTCNASFLRPLLCSGKTGSAESNMQQVHSVFTELCQDLRRLKDLPLSITSLQGASPTFRYTEVFPSLPWNGRMPSRLRAAPSEDSQSDSYYPSCDSATPPLVPVHPVICQLESSGRWPDELEAIRKIKLAFYVHICKALKEQKGLAASPTQEYLDILKSGHVFRLLIHHHRQLVLLKEADPDAASSTMAAKRRKEEAALAHRNTVALPVLTSTLNGLHQQFPAFGGGARLCKRWVSSHLLSNHLSDEAVELMVAYLFTSPAPYTEPSMDLVVFARFLSLLAAYSWEDEPLLVNFNKEISATKVSELCSEFTKNRPTLPPLVIVTPHDSERLTSPWTSNSSPSPPVFRRLQQLAREAGNVLSKLMLSSSAIDMDTAKQLFRTPLQDFNVLIHLDRKHIPCSHQAVDAMATTSHTVPHVPRQYTHFPVVDFDPVQIYLKELEAAFSDLALFFYDKHGGLFIAVLWKPDTLVPQSLKVGKAHCKVQAKGKKATGMVKVDLEAVVADFQLMGEGLVKNIELLTPPPSN